jgi:hypothetical protein
MAHSEWIQELKKYEKGLNNDVKEFIRFVAKDGKYLDNDGSELDGVSSLLLRFNHLNRRFVRQ